MWTTNNFKKVPIKVVKRITGDDEVKIRFKPDAKPSAEDKAIYDRVNKKKVNKEEYQQEEDIHSIWDEFMSDLGKVGIVILCMIGWLIYWVSSIESPQEKIERIQVEISEAQAENIAAANVWLVRLDSRREIILRDLSSVLSDIAILNNCVKLNETEELPVDCSTVTISLQQRLNWKVNSNWNSQEFIELKAKETRDRTIELLNKYTITRDTYTIWEEFENIYWIKKELAIAIAKADSSLWDEMKSINNIGNVGNNDRWDVVSFKTKRDWIEAIFVALNNKYLNTLYTVGYLSEWGRRVVWGMSCKVSGEFCYATSEENWNINVINTLRLIYNDPTIDESFEFRIK